MIGSFQILHAYGGWSVLFRVFMYMDSVHFKTCDWSQVSRRCPWRFLANSKTEKTEKPVPVQPSRRAIFRRPDTPQCLEASALKMSGHQSNIVRTLGQASPISTQSWISVVDIVWEVSARRPDDVRTLSSFSEYFRLSVRTDKRVIEKTI